MSDCSARRSSKMPHPNDLHRSTQSASAPPGDAAQLPQGQCRYILTIPELKGHRCGCMGFHHNTSLPGATCYCGHFSCFHSSTSLKTSEDITALKKRVRELEAQVQQKGSYQLENLVGRISDLEETVEGNQEEAANQLKASYQNSSAAWQVIEALQERIKSLENYCQLYYDGWRGDFGGKDKNAGGSRKPITIVPEWADQFGDYGYEVDVDWVALRQLRGEGAGLV
ncbi:hypothetical protein FOC4_g10007800 [Fusarium odoratissimum]|uniref:Uncharacterized protein n=2 Tax=Fusarium oxysporum species complex TaxID=171631 RepID=N1RNM5_FUSC4|nr:hypothetical protein FOC4_g10007800 [Fusarium odoratissimum]TXC00214.1 hypothetical protein FocTR4_00014510 [Fusarium oxysporum f. sp. cubense]